MEHPYFDGLRKHGAVQAATGLPSTRLVPTSQISLRVGGVGSSIGNVRKSSSCLNDDSTNEAACGGATKRNKTSSRASDPGLHDWKPQSPTKTHNESRNTKK